LGQGGKQRFLWVHYFDPHAPYDAPEPHRSAHGNRRYDAEIAYTDAEIGRLLKEIGIGSRSIITVLTSDHGESLGEHGEKTHGLFVYQATMDVPLIVHWPGHLPAGTTVDAPVSLVDLVPTLLGVLGYPEPAGLDGGSFGLEEGGGAPSRPVYGESFLPKYLYTFSELRMVRNGSLKYIDAPTPELYDLREDPDELRNLEGGHPDQDRLTTILADILADEDPEMLGHAAGTLDPEAEANLRSLGYLSGTGGSGSGVGSDRGRDPKDMVRYIKDLDRVHGIIASGNVEAGFALLESLVAEVPENHMALLQYAAELLEVRRFPEAEEQLLKLLDLQPEMNAAWVMLGGVRAARGEIDPAAEAYSMAGALTGRGEPYFQMASMFRNVGEYRDASNAYLEAVNREPSNREYMDGWMELHISRGTLAEAETASAVLANEHPGEPVVRNARGDILHRLQRYEEAAQELQAALTLERGMYTAETLLGHVELELGRIVEAGDRFRILVDRRPEDTSAQFGLAKALSLKGEHQAAAALFRQLLEDRPDFSPVFTFRGRVLEKEGDRSGAARMYQEALRLNRGDREAWEGYQRVRPR
jgi:tetratricopeptide (TPR) repeat protein